MERLVELTSTFARETNALPLELSKLSKISSFFVLVICLTSNLVHPSYGKTVLSSNKYTFANYIGNQKAFEKEDDHLKGNKLLQVPLPSNDRIILNYDEFKNYRNNRLKNNFSYIRWVWKERSSKGKILDKQVCLMKLANFEMPTTPKPEEIDFVKCQLAFQAYAVSDLDAGISLYQELFLLMANSKTDKWVYRKSFSKNNNPRGYHLVGVLAPLIMFYTANYDRFDLNTGQRQKINSYLRDKSLQQNFDEDGDNRQLNCPIFKPLSLSKYKHRVNNCGTGRIRFAAAELALAITIQDELLWKKGLWDLDFTLSMIDHDGFWVPTSAKGCKALGYTYSASQLISINVEMLNLAGFDLLEYQARHGRKIFEAYGKLLEQYGDITISNHIAKKAIGSSSCGDKPYTKHIDFVRYEHPTGEWIPSNAQFYNWSMRYIVNYRSNLIEDIYLGKVGVHPFVGAYFSVQPFEIYRANISGKHLSFWQDKLVNAPKKPYYENLAELLEAKPKYRKIDAKTELFEGEFNCKIDLIRSLSSTGERGPIGFGFVTIQNGKVNLKDIRWNTGAGVKWSDISGFSSLNLKADGHLHGILPVLTMFGNNRIELFEFSGENSFDGEQSQVNGFYKVKGSEDVTIEIEIHDC